MSIGIALGFVASTITTRLLEWRTVVSPGAVALAFGTALLIGVFFGFYPARRASMLDPIDALRLRVDRARLRESERDGLV